ncbi:hypothetical protein E4T56_gene365 [Termitomyces sp. T112]|nr:hypothetical protein E4T56_gene365 [Termitomyces sp. T112]
MHLRPLPPPAPPPKPTQPTNPHRVTLVLTLGLPTSSPMKEPLTPRRNNPWNKPRSISAEASHSPTNPRAAPAQKKHPPIQLQQSSRLEGVSEIRKTPLSISGLTFVSLHTPRNDEEALKSTKVYDTRRSRAANSKTTRSGTQLPPHSSPGTPTIPLPPNQSPSGPAPPPRPPPAWAKPPPHPPPLPTTTLGPLHYAVDALPATSPPSPSPAATPEADPRASAPTHLESMQMLWRHHPREPGAPTPNLAPNTIHFVTGGEPCWPANPPSALLPPTLPIADQPPAPFPAPPPPPWAAPPAVSDAPASSVPPALAPAPPAPRCSTPAPMPPSLPMPHLNPPLPVKAPPPAPSMPLLALPPTCKGRPP